MQKQPVAVHGNQTSINQLRNRGIEPLVVRIGEVRARLIATYGDAKFVANAATRSGISGDKADSSSVKSLNNTVRLMRHLVAHTLRIR